MKTISKKIIEGKTDEPVYIKLGESFRYDNSILKSCEEEWRGSCTGCYFEENKLRCDNIFCKSKIFKKIDTVKDDKVYLYHIVLPDYVNTNDKITEMIIVAHDKEEVLDIALDFTHSSDRKYNKGLRDSEIEEVGIYTGDDKNIKCIMFSE